MKMQAFRAGGMLTSMAGSLLFAFGALADPLGFAVPVRYPAIIFQQVLPDRGEDVVLSPDGKTAYVAVRNAGVLEVINTSSGSAVPWRHSRRAPAPSPSC